MFVRRWSATAATQGPGGGAVIVQSRLFHRQKVTPVQKGNTCTKMSPRTPGEKESCLSDGVSSNKSNTPVIFSAPQWQIHLIVIMFTCKDSEIYFN